MKQPDIERTSSEDATTFVRDALYMGPVYRKLYSLRESRPEIAHDLDDLAAALRQLGDRIEAFMRQRLA